MDNSKTPQDQIREALEQLGGATPAQEDIDLIHTYHMEQAELANELYESAVADGVNFAVTDETGDVFVNTKWLGMVVRTIAEAIVMSPEPASSTVRSAEVLNQTILAARKFVGQE